MNRYVAGFLFNPDYSEVVLTRKNSNRAYARGYLNGVGGKLEGWQKFPVAMSCEFLEQTGLYICSFDWRVFHEVKFEETKNHITFFEASSINYNKVIQMTSSEVKIYKVQDILNDNNGRLKLYHDVPALINKVLIDRP